MPELATTTINIGVDPETIRDAIDAALDARDDRANQLARKHARATDQVRTLTLHANQEARRRAEQDIKRTAERIDFQRKIENLGQELRVAQSTIRKAEYGIHKFPSRLTADDGSTYTLRLDEAGRVLVETTAPCYGAVIPAKDERRTETSFDIHNLEVTDEGRAFFDELKSQNRSWFRG